MLVNKSTVFGVRIRLLILRLAAHRLLKLQERDFVSTALDEIGELFEKFGMSVAVEWLPLGFLVPLEHHVLEHIHQIVRTGGIDLGMTVAVRPHKVAWRVRLGVLSSLSWVPSHVNDGEGRDCLVLLPQMQFNEHVCSILSRNKRVLGTPQIFLEVLAVLLDSLNQIQYLLRDELPLVLSEIELYKRVLLLGFECLV